MVDQLADDLQAQGVPADRLHGGIAQAQRTRVMNKFKKAGFEFLVATDVAARGIDVHDLELVVNFDLPYDPEDYVHRIGRTGRAGKHGMAVTLVSGRDLRKIQFLERFARTKIRRGTLPTAGEIGEKRADALLAKVRTVLDEGTWRGQAGLVDRLLEEGVDSTELAAALFQILTGPTPEATENTAPTKPALPSPTREAAVKSTPPKSRGGRAWITLSLGRGELSGPRDVVDLFVDYAGLSAQDVGRIELGEGTSLVEVPAGFAQGLSPGGNWFETANGSVKISPVAEASKGRKTRR
jgi:ATP-dependent RNA helicase DeaD